MVLFITTGRVIGVFNTLDAVPLLSSPLPSVPCIDGRPSLLLLPPLWCRWWYGRWWSLPLLPVDEPKVVHAFVAPLVVPLVVGEADMVLLPLLLRGVLGSGCRPLLPLSSSSTRSPASPPLVGLRGVRLYMGCEGGSGIDEAKGWL